jgi:lysyl-tRNA synthetase, class II
MALEDIKQSRVEKLTHLKDKGVNPYPIKSRRTHVIEDIVKQKNELIKNEKNVVVGGRVESVRGHGGSSFLNIKDESGNIQLFFRKDTLGEEKFLLFRDVLDIGDFIEVSGTIFNTKSGELTVHAKSWKMLTKSTNQLPSQWHGLKDSETKLRKRYLELLTNPEFKKRIEFRSKFIKCLRTFMDGYGFLEVETPILQAEAGGALASPFKTRLNSLGIDLYLRIAPELYLKRLIVGGFEKIYEIGKNFRNEGIDHSHNPEFTEMEFYWAYSDHEKLMDFTEEMMRELVKIIDDKESKFHQYFSEKLPRLDYQKILKDHVGIDCDKITKEELKKILKEKKLDTNKEGDKWTLIDELFKKVCLKEINYPFFLINHPLSISPLAKKNENSDTTVARFQLIIEGLEVVNAYSELNDPIDQKSRFESQQERTKNGEREIHPYDKDFVEALEYGMPPTAGWGMGIDRVVALMTGSISLKEVLAFPLIRPKN